MIKKMGWMDVKVDLWVIGGQMDEKMDGEWNDGKDRRVSMRQTIVPK